MGNNGLSDKQIIGMLHTGLSKEQVIGMIRGINSGNLSQLSERDISVFHQSFSEQLERNRKNEDVLFGEWVSGAKTDFGFRKQVLNHAIANWDKVTTGTPVDADGLSVYDEYIAEAFSQDGRPTRTTAEQRAHFMMSYIEHVSSKYDFANNKLDTDRAKFEVRHYFSDDMFFESKFGHKETYMNLLTHRKSAEISAINDMRDNIYTKEQARDAAKLINNHEGFLEDAFTYKDSKFKAMLVFYELEDTELSSDDKHILNNATKIQEKYPDLLKSVHDYREAVRVETSIVDAQFTVDSYELVSEFGVAQFKDSDIDVTDWNGYIPKLNYETSLNEGLLFSEPLPDATSAVTTEMLIGNVVNDSAEALQEKHDMLSNTWSVRDFVNYRDQAQQIFERHLEPEELIEYMMPMNLSAYDVLEGGMTRKVVHDADTIHALTESLDSEADRYYGDHTMVAYERDVLFGSSEDIKNIFGNDVWNASKLSQTFDEPRDYDLPTNDLEVDTPVEVEDEDEWDLEL